MVDKYDGKRLNSPNDLAYKTNGDLYFTDPPYGLPGVEKDPKKELDFQGVYRLSPKGELTLLTREMSRPNGIAFSPDEKTLYVANSDPDKAVWMAFPVKADGTLDKGKVFFDGTAMVKEKGTDDKPKYPGLPDGLKVDKAGQRVGHRAGRGVGVRQGRQAPRHPRHRGAHRQRGVGGRRRHPVHHRRQATVPGEDEGEGVVGVARFGRTVAVRRPVVYTSTTTGRLTATVRP